MLRRATVLWIWAIFSFTFVLPAFADDEQDLSLKDILDVKVVTASKSSERLFETPLSTFVVTREEIKNAGVTTIAEAFRLVPGFIVRQITNGNYDPISRGMDGMPYNNFWPTTANSETLVMIDNRIVYSYFQGGTFWESLPIGLDDVEQIEVVRGPVAALYGPNAVSGAINIMTRKPTKEGLSTWGSGEAGTQSVARGNVSVSQKAKDWSVTASVNYDRRNRFTSQYFDYFQQAYVPLDKLTHHIDSESGQVIYGGFTDGTSTRYPEPDLGWKQLGGNLFASFQPSNSLSFDVQTGYQTSRTQTIYVDNLETPLTTRDSTTGYVDLKAKAKDFEAHVALLTGKQDSNTGGFNLLAGGPSGCTAVSGVYICPPTLRPGFFDINNPAYNFQYNFTQIDTSISYDYRTENFRLRPELGVRYANYNGSYIGGSRTLNDYSATLMSEYKLDSWRFVGAIRGDRYTQPSKPYYSGEVVLTKQIGSNHQLRAVYSHANKAAAMGEIFLNLNVPAASYLGSGQTGATFICMMQSNLGQGSLPACVSFVMTNLLGGQDLAVYASSAAVPYRGDTELALGYGDLFEVGHRMKLTSNLVFDNEVFLSMTKNYPAVNNIAGPMSFPSYQVQPTAGAVEVGVTSSTSYVPSSELQGRFYVTIQETNLLDTNGNVIGKYQQTPQIFGGLIVNYRPMPKLNINVNPYFISTQQFQTQANVLAAPLTGPIPGPQTIPNRVIVNAKVSYDLMPKTSLFVNARNALGTTNPEFGFGDQGGGLYTAGISAEF